MFSLTIILDLTNVMYFEASTKMTGKSDRIQKLEKKHWELWKL